MMSIVAVVIVGCDHTVNNRQNHSESICGEQPICDSLQNEYNEEEPAISLNELIASLEEYYSDSTNHYFDPLERDFFEENRNSPIDSCTIEFWGDRLVNPVIKLTKEGSVVYNKRNYSTDSASTRMAAIISPYLTRTLLKYIDNVYFSRTAGKVRSNREMRAKWSCEPVILVNIYSEGRHIEDRYFGKSCVFEEGNLYDYSYEVASLIDLAERIVYDFQLKANEIEGLIPLRDFRTIE